MSDPTVECCATYRVTDAHCYLFAFPTAATYEDPGAPVGLIDMELLDDPLSVNVLQWELFITILVPTGNVPAPEEFHRL